MKDSIEKVYREQLERYKTKEEKIQYLKDCEFNIQMVDRWTNGDRISYEVVTQLLHELCDNGSEEN